MKRIQSLIRLRRWQLDEKRRQHAELLKHRDLLLQESQQLISAVTVEGDVVRKSLDIMPGYDAYVRRALAERSTLERAIADSEALIAVSQDTLAETYLEVKKYELTSEGIARRLQADEERRQQQSQDELSIDLYRRQHKA